MSVPAFNGQHVEAGLADPRPERLRLVPMADVSRVDAPGVLIGHPVLPPALIRIWQRWNMDGEQASGAEEPKYLTQSLGVVRNVLQHVERRRQVICARGQSRELGGAEVNTRSQATRLCRPACFHCVAIDVEAGYRGIGEAPRQPVHERGVFTAHVDDALGVTGSQLGEPRHKPSRLHALADVRLTDARAHDLFQPLLQQPPTPRERPYCGNPGCLPEWHACHCGRRVRVCHLSPVNLHQ
jgi:hypothetical protein